MPLPVIFFGAIKALAAVATWTTGEVVAVSAVSVAGTGAGVYYRNEIGAYFKYLFGYSVNRDIRPLPEVIQNIENTEDNLRQKINNQKTAAEVNREQANVLSINHESNQRMILLAQESSRSVHEQAHEFNQLIEHINNAINSPASSIDDLKKLSENFRAKFGTSGVNQRALEVVNKLLSKIQDMEEKLNEASETISFYEEELDTRHKSEKQSDQYSLASHSIFISANNVFAHSAVGDSTCSI